MLDVVQEALNRPMVLLALAVAVLLVRHRRAWALTRTVITVVHEAGHALAAVLTGRGLVGIRLHRDTSGLTVSTGASGGPGLVLTVLAGYLAPSLLGVLAAALVGTGRSTVLLWACAAGLGLTLVWVRNPFGAFVVLLLGIGVAALAWYGTPEVDAGAAALLAWLMLVGGLRAIGELARDRRSGRGHGDDASMLARMTGIPAVAWVMLDALVGLAALILGAWLMLIR